MYNYITHSKHDVDLAEIHTSSFEEMQTIDIMRQLLDKTQTE